jgi:hypothetical protein
MDATATDLGDCFTDTPDLSPYEALPVPAELFDPAKADLKPPPAIDDPQVLRRQ